MNQGFKKIIYIIFICFCFCIYSAEINSKDVVYDAGSMFSSMFNNGKLKAPQKLLIDNVTAKLEEKYNFDSRKLSEPYGEEWIRERALKTTNILVEKKFPPLDKAVLGKEAVAKYPLYEKGDIVEFFYRPNPRRTGTIKGEYVGKTDTALKIGRKLILIADVEAVPGNDKVLERFDEPTVRSNRQLYIEEKLKEYNDRREVYRKQVYEVALRKEKADANRLNQEGGYLLLKGQWMHISDLLLEVYRIEKNKYLAKLAAEAKARQLDWENEIRTEEAGYAAFFASSPEYYFEDALKAKQEADRLKAEEEARIAAEKAAAEKARLEAEKKAEEEAKRKARQEKMRQLTEELDLGSDEGLPIMYIVIAVIVIILGIVIGVVIFKIKKKRQDPANFFKGKGKLQKNFWQMAEEDPDHFFFVAYRYHSMQDARNALLSLSYMRCETGNEIKCRYDIMFGSYPHKDKFVAFVGGKGMAYAPWREASAEMPELFDAEFFRVSVAPPVDAESRKAEQVLEETNLEIKFVKEKPGEGTVTIQLYEGADKETAITFLKKMGCNDPDILVMVKCPEGTFGIDENGIFEEEE